METFLICLFASSDPTLDDQTLTAIFAAVIRSGLTMLILSVVWTSGLVALSIAARLRGKRLRHPKAYGCLTIILASLAFRLLTLIVSSSSALTALLVPPSPLAFFSTLTVTGLLVGAFLGLTLPGVERERSEAASEL